MYCGTIVVYCGMIVVYCGMIVDSNAHSTIDNGNVTAHKSMVTVPNTLHVCLIVLTIGVGKWPQFQNFEHQF